LYLLKKAATFFYHRFDGPIMDFARIFKSCGVSALGDWWTLWSLYDEMDFFSRSHFRVPKNAGYLQSFCSLLLYKDSNASHDDSVQDIMTQKPLKRMT
jgi:hypothetical protein